MIATYILKCNDGCYYVGSTNNLIRRIKEHRTKQCSFTKSRLPVELFYSKIFNNLKEARSFEFFIKKQRNIKFYFKLRASQENLGPIV